MKTENNIELERKKLLDAKKMLTGYASIDKPWLNLYQEFEEDKSLVNMSIYQKLAMHAQEHLNTIAMWMPGKNYEGGLKITYKEYIQYCQKIAKSFDYIGAKTQEIIPIILPNIPESRCSIYGLNYLGGISYPIMPSLPPKELEKILINNSVDKVIIFSGFYEKYKKVFQDCNVHCIVITNGTGMLPEPVKMVVKTMAKLKGTDKTLKYSSNIMFWDEFIKSGKSRNVLEPYYKENEIATIIGTSGTTGVSKGAMYTNESINYQAYNHALAGIDFQKGDKILDILIQSISYGFSVMHYCGCFGLTSIIIPDLVTDKIAEVIYKTNPQHFTGGPVHYIYMSKSELFKEGKLQPMKNAISGGAKLPTEVEKELNKDKIYVHQGYGSTECLGGVTGPLGEYKLGSIGTPLPLVTMGIFKPGTDEELKYNETGEICVYAPTIMAKYLNNEVETSIALKQHKDGNVWLHTKDLGYCDETGHFFFSDRISDTFMRCGFNVHPNKISEFISSLKYVKECHVLGVEHKTEQTVPVAIVVLEPQYIGQEIEIEKILKNECFENLDESSIPFEWIFTDNIERNLGGKIVNKQLIEKYNLDYSHSDTGKGYSLQRTKKE